MLDHIQIVVSDFARSLRFYEKLLEVLGYAKTRTQLDGQWDGDGSRVAFGQNGQAQFYLTDDGDDPHTGLRLCFIAATRAAVDEFFEASIEAGARKRKQPEDKPERGDDWYSCEMIDPDANIVEVVHRGDAKPMTQDEERDVLGEKIAAANALAEWEREKARRVAEAEAAKGKGRAGAGMIEVGTFAPVTPAPSAAEEDAEKGDDEETDEDDPFASLGGDSSDEDDPFAGLLGGDDEKKDDDDPFAGLLGDDEKKEDEEDPFAGLLGGTSDEASTESTDDTDWEKLLAGSGDDDAEKPAGGDDEIDWDALLKGDDDEKK